jgi:anhydro-N-acetylmuramic acid kinase
MKYLNYSNVIGLMSGTSADGIDISLVNTNGITLSSTKKNHIYPYSTKLKEKIRFIMNNPKYIWSKQSFIKTLEVDITNEHVDAVNFIKSKYGVKPSLIGFHGQTVYHDPKNKLSLQLGSGKLLAKKTNCMVVFNFRSNDIINGGEGAPLAPIYHKCILRKLFGKEASCIVNIGGVSNISYVNEDIMTGFDIGPGCGLMDEFVKKNYGKDFDSNGDLASNGLPSQKIVNNFLKNPFFKKIPPKSIDKFEFQKIFDTKDFIDLSIIDGIATLCSMTAASINMALQQLTPKPKFVLVAGGGRHNNHLLNLIQNKTDLRISKIDEYNIDGDYIEAELIAYLAVRFLNNLPSTYPFTTGAKTPIICGEGAI